MTEKQNKRAEDWLKERDDVFDAYKNTKMSISQIGRMMRMSPTMVSKIIDGYLPKVVIEYLKLPKIN